MRLELALFGGFVARLSSGAPVTLHAKKAQALLAYCATQAGQPQSREKLATLLWGNREGEQARNSLRQTLFILRAALPARVLYVEGDTIAVNPRTVQVDVADFQRGAAAGTAPALAEAAALYKGDFLEGLVVSAETFEEWLFSERERLRDIAVDVWARLLQHQREKGLVDAAIQTGRRLLSYDPALESVHRAVISLLIGQGRRAEAIRQYQACVRALKSDFGLEPEPQTQGLYQVIVNGAPVAEGSLTSLRPARTEREPGAKPVQRGLPAVASDERYALFLRALRAQERARRLVEGNRQIRVRMRGAVRRNVEHLSVSLSMTSGQTSYRTSNRTAIERRTALEHRLALIERRLAPEAAEIE